MSPETRNAASGKRLYRVLAYGSIAILLAMLGVALTKVAPDAEDGPEPEPPSHSGTASDIKPSVAETGRGGSDAPHPAPSAELGAKLEALRETYAAENTSPARIRIQGELNDLWETTAPVNLLLGEVLDTAAPPAYRIYFAKLLRNAAKTNATKTEVDHIGTALRGVIRSTDAAPEVRSAIGSALIDIDESDETIMAISTVLRETSGEIVTDAVGALCRTKNPAAKSVLWDFARNETARSDGRFPQALAAALAPLCLEPEIPVEQLLTKIVSRTGNSELFVTALRGLRARAPSVSGIQSLVAACKRSGKFPSLTTRIARFCENTIRQRASFVRENMAHFEPATQSDLSRILSP